MLLLNCMSLIGLDRHILFQPLPGCFRGYQGSEAELSKAQEELALTPADFQQYLEDEKKYLNNLKEPSPTVSRKIKYMQALMDLDRYQYVLISQKRLTLKYV